MRVYLRHLTPAYLDDDATVQDLERFKAATYAWMRVTGDDELTASEHIYDHGNWRELTDIWTGR